MILASPHITHFHILIPSSKVVLFVSKRIIAVICAVVTLFLTVPVAHADYINTPVGLWDNSLHRVVRGLSVVGGDGLASAILGQVSGSVCGSSSDGYHHANSLQGCTTGTDDQGLYANATCQYCNKSFKVYSADLKTAYEKKITELPSNGYSSDNSLLWYPSWDDLAYTQELQDNEGNLIFKAPFSSWYTGSVIGFAPGEYSISDTYFSYTKGRDNRSVDVHYSSSDRVRLRYPGSGPMNFTAPVSGTYFLQACPAYVCSYQLSDGSGVGRRAGSFSTASNGLHVLEGKFVWANRVYEIMGSYCSVVSGTMYFPVFRVVLDILPDDPTPDYTTIYNSTTRMGNIGGYYGTVNNDNSVTQYTTQYIVNEGDNTYTNPVTGQSQPILDWSYNYDDRSYTLNLEGGDTTNVTYGDEKVSINETYIDGNGNTVTNKYEVNYITNNGTGSGGGGGGETDPSPSPSPSTSPGGGGGSGSGNNPGGSGSGDGGGNTNPLSRVFQNYAANITQAYGTDGHGGTDCVPSSGAADTVTAHSEGDVVWVQTGQENDQGSSGDISYGNAVKIKHSNGYYTLYAHLATVEVAQGDHVYKGQALGMMGDTGNSYGAHLHFEVRDDTDTRQNSDQYLNADLPGLEGGGSTGKKHWWEKIGDLIGIGIGGLVDIIAVAIDKVMDSLINLLEMLIERLKTVVETILSVLDYLPSLFGGFLDLLGKLFPYLPEEITMILTFGVIAVVAIWIIKALMGR